MQNAACKGGWGAVRARQGSERAVQLAFLLYANYYDVVCMCLCALRSAVCLCLCVVLIALHFQFKLWQSFCRDA